MGGNQFMFGHIGLILLFAAVEDVFLWLRILDLMKLWFYKKTKTEESEAQNLTVSDFLQRLAASGSSRSVWRISKQKKKSVLIMTLINVQI